MDRVLAWNVRGVNNPKKQQEVKAFLHKHVVGLVGLLETKVKAIHLGDLYHKVFQGWCFSSNTSYHPGGRIVLAWKPGIFHVNIIKATSQLMHCFIEPMSKVHSFYCTFVYAFNQCGEREVLWNDLAQLHTTGPWLIMGDFNCVRYPNERIGAVVRAQEMMPMNNWCAGCGLDDLKSSGCFFTWNNKQQGYNRVFSNIDRALSNMAWQEIFPTAEVTFMPEGDFDHSPSLLTVYPRSDSGKKPFKYYTMWRHSPQYDSTVRDQWNKRVEGTKMFVVVQKLKMVKAALKNLNKIGFHDVQVDNSIAYHAMIDAQKEMHNHLGQIAYSEAEQLATRQYQVKHQIYTEYLKQKAKLEWIKHGDENTAVFHQSIRARRIQNQLYTITDAHGVWKDNAQGVEVAFIDYYQKLLGTNHVNRRHVFQEIVQTGPMITDEHRRVMNAPYIAEEVKVAMFSISGNKAPGPDGFGAHFYRDNWELVGNEVNICYCKLSNFSLTHLD
ncbi:uncharacterized protein LOC125495695 [Beta vulgaris subsp. vulgaris]|uniref:uncharacterized protein LOC125495695 n=1 Tax=Beta vulgaris subsp. vulgaris TaxID=3555 RepID=UPI0020368B76|nr:uncharacterized protein LOC125495695 [Beta vulgaris subsp. vulgaris]